MKIAISLLLLALSLPAMAQEDICGGASLTAMENAPPEKDPAMQAKLDRLLVSLRKSHGECLATLSRAHERDQRLGIASAPRPTAPTASTSTTATAAIAGPGVCSVISSTGKPCVQKVSEQLGKPGQSDQVVFDNSCINTIEISVLYNDNSRGLATVKPGASSTLLCDDCGGVKSTEAVCR